VLGFAVLVAVGTGIAVGLAGAFPVLRSDLSALRAGGRARTGPAGRTRLRGLLVMTECAFSVVLLVGAGLLVTSFFRLRAVDLGFDPEGVYTVEVPASARPVRHHGSDVELRASGPRAAVRAARRDRGGVDREPAARAWGPLERLHAPRRS
jgi:hypothetical protein